MYDAFAAAAEHQALYSENGSGYALKDAEGRFFCGFEQADGRCAYSAFRQQGHTGGAPEISFDGTEYDCEKPVFLTPDDMKAKGLGAAVFPLRPQVFSEPGIPSAVKKTGRFSLVRKDLTFKADSESGSLNPSVPGLASADACIEGEDRGYVSIIKEFMEAVRAAGRYVRRTLVPGTPDGPR